MNTIDHYRRRCFFLHSARTGSENLVNDFVSKSPTHVSHRFISKGVFTFHRPFFHPHERKFALNREATKYMISKLVQFSRQGSRPLIKHQYLCYYLKCNLFILFVLHLLHMSLKMFPYAVNDLRRHILHITLVDTRRMRS
jgi:hypothetical protein